MNSFQRSSSELATMALRHSTSRRAFSPEFANLLIAFEDEYAEIGQLWLDGTALSARGKKLSGWFVGQEQMRGHVC